MLYEGLSYLELELFAGSSRRLYELLLKRLLA